MKELRPQLYHQRSYYKKAMIIEDGDIVKLKSYNSLVLLYNKASKEIYLNKNISYNLLFSHTTLRHMVEFLYQMTDRVYNKKEIEKVCISYSEE